MSQRKNRSSDGGRSREHKEQSYQYHASHSDGEYDYQASDPDDERPTNIDEFGGAVNIAGREKMLKTGRQRKKLAARTKGGEFAARRRKRRVYFCCISSDIDIQKLFDYLVGAGGLLHGWKYQLYPGGDALHLYKPNHNPDDKSATSAARELNPLGRDIDENGYEISQTYQGMFDQQQEPFDDSLQISSHNSQEVFVFDFGAAVFWGFSRGEETNLLKTFRMFVTKGYVEKDEFQSGEDDMAFSSSPDAPDFSIANDFITLPEQAPVKQRLSVSFAIAQSSVLAIFEARIERKIEEYKYIPETLAAYGKVHLSERQLGIMIGEVFVVRHDVNLHTEILDTPAFFWKEERFEMNYQMVMEYLEMSGRTQILNKRLDMLRELLDVLQHQMENEHGVKLEWIVIWLIVAEVLVQLFASIYG